MVWALSQPRNSSAEVAALTEQAAVTASHSDVPPCSAWCGNLQQHVCPGVGMPGPGSGKEVMAFLVSCCPYSLKLIMKQKIKCRYHLVSQVGLPKGKPTNSGSWLIADGARGHGVHSPAPSLHSAECSWGPHRQLMCHTDLHVGCTGLPPRQAGLGMSVCSASAWPKAQRVELLSDQQCSQT